MFIQNKRKKRRLGVGIHSVVIKQMNMLIDHNTMQPLTTVDPKNGETVSGLEVLFMGADEHGTILRIWLTEDGLAQIRNMCKAIGIEDSDERQADASEIIGKRLFILVAQVFIYDNFQPRRDDSGNHVWMPEAQPVFFKCVDRNMAPKMPGDPNYNNGIASGEFIKHRDFAVGLIDPPTGSGQQQIDWSKVVIE